MPPASPIVAWLLTYQYAIAYPLAIVEGPVVMMVAGFLVRLEILRFWPMFFLLSAGDLTGDVVWYWIGRHGARHLIDRYGYLLDLTEEKIERAEHFLNNHQGKILFFSKITMGFGFALATLMAAGAARVPFKKYMTINAVGQLFWTGFLMGVGYFFGHLYTLVDSSLRWAFVGAVVVIILLIVYGFGKFMRKKFNV